MGGALVVPALHNSDGNSHFLLAKYFYAFSFATMKSFTEIEDKAPHITAYTHAQKWK